MRKKFFLLAVAVLLVGVFLFFQKEEKAIEEKIDSLVAANLNQPYHIQQLERFPFVREATLTLTSYERDLARSLFRLVLDNSVRSDVKQIEIPLVSVITRGGSKHDGDSFGFAHVVTHPELAGLRDTFPLFPGEITDKTFRVEHFIDYDGSLRELCVIEPLDFQDSQNRTVAHIGGGQVRIDTSIFDRKAGEVVAQAEKMWLKEKANMAMEIRPFHLEGRFRDDGTYTGKSSVIDLVVTDESVTNKGESVVHFSEGTYSGKLKHLEGINVNLGSSQAHFDVVSIKRKNVDAAFENIELESGIYEADDNLFELRWSFSGKPKMALPPILPDGVDIQKIGLQYEVKKVTPRLLNFAGSVFSSDYVLDTGKEKTVLENLLQILQQSEAEFVFSAFLDEAKGKGEVKGNVVLSSYARKLNVSDFSTSDAKKLFNAWANFRLDKAVADVFGMDQIFLRDPSQFILKDDVFSSSVMLQDGNVKVNGQELR